MWLHYHFTLLIWCDGGEILAGFCIDDGKEIMHVVWEFFYKWMKFYADKGNDFHLLKQILYRKGILMFNDSLYFVSGLSLLQNAILLIDQIWYKLMST